jgi:periplasmic protein TonB
MSPLSRPTPETVSHFLALALTAGVGSFLLAPQRDVEPQTTATPAIQIALQPEPAPPEPAAPAPEPPKTQRPVVHHEVRQPVAPPLMAAVVSSPAEFSPPEDTAPSPEAPMSPPPKPSSGTVDAQYAATLRSNIDSRTAPPSSTEYRLFRPRGEVLVNFTLDRTGMMVSTQLARSSGSKLLDSHALEIVRSGRYPAFPGDAFQGESRHSFLITLEFHS